MLFANNFGDGLSLLFQFFPPVQIVLSHLFQVLIKQNFSLLAVFSFFSFSEYLEDVLLKEIRVRVTDIDQFESIFDCDFISASQVVHQKLNQVEKVARFEARFIKNASFVH